MILWLKDKSLIVFGTAGVLVLVLGVLGVSYAYAQGPEPPAEGRHLFGTEGFPGGWLLDHVRSRRAIRGGCALAEATARVTGLSEDKVGATLREGQTFAEIAQGEGVDLQDVVDAVMAEQEARLQPDVETGRLTEE